MKKHMLTIYHRGEVIEQRESDTPFPNILVGEQLHIEFVNPHYNEEHGMWWIVRKRAHLITSDRIGLHALHLHCEPDPDKGDMFA